MSDYRRSQWHDSVVLGLCMALLWCGIGVVWGELIRWVDAI